MGLDRHDLTGRGPLAFFECLENVSKARIPGTVYEIRAIGVPFRPMYCPGGSCGPSLRHFGVEGMADELNSSWNIRSPFSKPSAGSLTDFALPTGFEMRPWACSRSIAAQSKPFQAMPLDCRLSHKSARTAASILSLLPSICLLPPLRMQDLRT